jgi:hypothetical protein
MPDTMKTAETPAPFGTLAGWTTIVGAILFLAGFAYKWSYYYNFGVQHLVFRQTVQQILVASIELIRLPQNLFFTIVFIGGPLLLLNLLIVGIPRLNAKLPTKWGDGLSGLGSSAGLNSPAFLDVLRAVVILYACFMVSAQIGYYAFQNDTVDADSNVLPHVTIVWAKSDDTPRHVLGCGVSDLNGIQLIGDDKLVRFIQENHRTCNGDSKRDRRA